MHLRSLAARDQTNFVQMHMKLVILCTEKPHAILQAVGLSGFLVRNLEPWIERQKSGQSGWLVSMNLVCTDNHSNRLN